MNNADVPRLIVASRTKSKCNAASKKSWVDAGPSTHLFEADLQDDLPPGTHVVSVRATDEFGRTHHGHTILDGRRFEFRGQGSALFPSSSGLRIIRSALLTPSASAMALAT